MLTGEGERHISSREVDLSRTDTPSVLVENLITE